MGVFSFFFWPRKVGLRGLFQADKAKLDLNFFTWPKILVKGGPMKQSV